ncbi:unnamed protein product [Toxocara canis]|uniref:ZP domain-containing protein n=1 Tax=Toxocara canis TaxID=6265 RepID=A0A183UBR2_TOXCA|nr:unnamed protein product [Toxocara canis]
MAKDAKDKADSVMSNVTLAEGTCCAIHSTEHSGQITKQPVHLHDFINVPLPNVSSSQLRHIFEVRCSYTKQPSDDINVRLMALRFTNANLELLKCNLSSCCVVALRR